MNHIEKYIMIELTLLKELISIKQVHQKSVTFVITGIFKRKGLSFNRMPVMDVMMMSMNLSDIAILNINGAGNHCIITGISNSEAINLIQNIHLSEKRGTL